MEGRDERCRGNRGASQHGADRAEQRGMLCCVPERVSGKDDINWRGQERRRVSPPGVWDDGAVLSDVIARHVLAECVYELCVGKVAGDDADVRIAFGDEDAW